MNEETPMTLNAIFDKPIDRPIEGVIKADDEASLRLEIEEYVLTNEVAKRLESFLDAYNNYENANGVWISGFFGSGKSHLLKMLAILLENRQIDGASALDLFLPKCSDNKFLVGGLNNAVGIPSKSILFNIDQKADVISKIEIDALLAVFVKVFDEMCGYYGKQGHIAQFERDLDNRGLYEQFKSAYETTAGRTWQKGRDQALLETKNIAIAYAQSTGDDEEQALGIIDRYRNQYRVSIEDFAEQVYDYVEKQSPDFRLNFCVDEVGQYIAENVKLMTNLQTIAESLATKCRGRAWVIVTAQEDMGTVVGEMSNQEGNDFSKIQDRFANRMKLTSADVAEVIQKRLLTKTLDGVQLLSDVYNAQSNNFKTLFDFSDGSQTYRNFQDQDHFTRSYPFIPYQFSLLQSSIQNLSNHNAFEGRHSSVGERSMLGVFQEVAIQISDHEIGQLATFDLMFEGIRTALKSNIQRAIIQAENNLDDPFAIRLLKTLFLVKYVKEFKPTLRNLSVLMLDGFNQDLPELRKRIEEALSLLEQQTFVQRNGELYEYLTDEEKDIEQEIKNTEVEVSDVAVELEKLVFDHVIKDRKIRYEENKQDYPFSRKLDDRIYGREQELAIHVISPFHENSENESTLRMQSMGRDELLVVMPADERLVRDTLMYKRTEKYIRQNNSITQQEAVKRILADKAFQNRERYAELRQHVRNLMAKAKLIVAGADVEINSENAQTRLLQGFQEIVSRAYPNLRMLHGMTYTENDISNYLKHSQQGLFGNDATSLDESEQELLAFVQSNSNAGERTTIKKLLARFERKPYGWNYAGVLCTVAKLCARGKVEISADGNILEEEALERALRNTHGHGNVVLEPQVAFTASQVRVLKEFFEDFFDAPPQASEAIALGKEIGAAFQDHLQQLSQLSAQSPQYPFLNALTPVVEKIKEITGKPYTWYLIELKHEEETLLEMKEGVIDPVRKFMTGSQRNIFDVASKFIETQIPNFAYIEGDEATRVIASLDEPDCFKGNHMQDVKILIDSLEEKITAQVDAEISKAKEAITDLNVRLRNVAEYDALNSEQQEQITRPFNEFIAAIEGQKLIAVIRDRTRLFEENEYQSQLSQMTAWARPAAETSLETSPGTETGGTAAQDKDETSRPPEPRVEYVLSRAVNVLFEKAYLVDETDVDSYLESMREALLGEIQKGKRIQI